MKLFGRFIFFLLIGLLLFGFLSEVRQTAVYQPPNPLPQLVYLGKGGSYTVDPDFNFIVKRLNPFSFEFQPGPTYDALANEDVWRSFGTNGNPPTLFEEDIKLADVTAGCVVRYVAIDDQMDGRRNRFLLDDVELIHLMPEGMVVEGSFTIPRDGALYYDARDSVAIYIDICGTFIGAPTETPPAPPAETATPTPTGTAVMLPTEPPTTTTTTPTVDPPLVVTSTPTPSQTATFTPGAPPAATGTATLSAAPPTGTATPAAGATVTRIPVKSCLRINFEVGGDVALNGRYIVKETGGRTLFSWTAEAGWQDSGWVYEIPLSHEAVYVQVFYEAGDGTTTEMAILNPAPGTSFGWLSRGICHALEVGWP